MEEKTTTRAVRLTDAQTPLGGGRVVLITLPDGATVDDFKLAQDIAENVAKVYASGGMLLGSLALPTSWRIQIL